jgi:hypothetical protein
MIVVTAQDFMLAAEIFAKYGLYPVVSWHAV